GRAPRRCRRLLGLQPPGAAAGRSRPRLDADFAQRRAQEGAGRARAIRVGTLAAPSGWMRWLLAVAMVAGCAVPRRGPSLTASREVCRAARPFCLPARGMELLLAQA